MSNTYLSESLKKRKIIVASALALIVLSIIIFFSIPAARADSYTDIHSQSVSSVEGLSNEAVLAGGKAFSDFKKNYLIYYGDIKSYIGDGLMVTITDIFGPDGLGSEVTNTADTKLSGALTKLNLIMTGLGCVLCFFYAMSNIFKEMQHGDMGPDMWFKISILGVVGFILVLFSNQIVDGFEGIGKYLVNMVSRVSLTADASVDMSSWLDSLCDFGGKDIMETGSNILKSRFYEAFSNNIGVYVSTGFKYVLVTVVFIFLQIPLISVRISLYSIYVEIVLRKIFFPLAVANCVGEGPRSPGLTYIKKIFAQYVRIALCMLIAYICTVLINAVISNINFGGAAIGLIGGCMQLVMIIALYMAATGLMKQTAGLASQIVG